MSSRTPRIIARYLYTHVYHHEYSMTLASTYTDYNSYPALSRKFILGIIFFKNMYLDTPGYMLASSILTLVKFTCPSSYMLVDIITALLP
jgi:fatty acid desaturase